MRILILGTSSGAGKTTVAAMACRWMRRNGMDVAPFKGLNLSLNSYASSDGGEIGMGQAFQAWACGLEPVSDMNPVLLKPCGDGRIQLILHGKPSEDLRGGGGREGNPLLKEAASSLGKMSSEHGFIVCEGSGSPAELNLMDRDVANTGIMRACGVPAVLVGDIERGGVFAALYGTWRLIPDDLKPLVKGFVINRFRGDPDILEPGIKRLEEMTGMRCIGVIRHEHLRFPEEDSLSEHEGRLDGTDVRQAYLDNLDALTDHAEEGGFRFDLLLKMMA